MNNLIYLKVCSSRCKLYITHGKQIRKLAIVVSSDVVRILGFHGWSCYPGHADDTQQSRHTSGWRALGYLSLQAGGCFNILWNVFISSRDILICLTSSHAITKLTFRLIRTYIYPNCDKCNSESGNIYRLSNHTYPLIRGQEDINWAIPKWERRS